MILNLLNRFDPQPDLLLHDISRHIDDDMLKCISAADYGDLQDEHMAALRQVRDTGTFPQEMYWCPMEVLELIRWSEPEYSNWKPGETGEFGHWMRAFSCAAILRAEHEPYNYSYNDGSTDSTVIQMIQSLRALPVDFSSQAAKNLSWLLLRSDTEGRDDSVRVYGVGLLWFALQVLPPVPDEILISLADWVVIRADELNWRAPAEYSGLRDMVIQCQKRAAWELLGCELCSLEFSKRSPELRVWIEMIGEQLAG